jgi:hypothetical protein
MSQGMKLFFSRIFPLIFIAGGAAIAFIGLHDLIRARASADWPSIRGRIVESSVDRYLGKRPKGRSRTSYYARILYEFSVDGTTFYGHRVAYGDDSFRYKSDVQDIVSRYPKGKDVIVHYMPGNPAESLLEPGLNGRLWSFPVIGFIFFIVGILMAAFVPKAMKKQEII